jgi:hypothetical protein
LTPWDVVSYIFGTYIDTNKVHSKYNVIIFKFKMLLGLECYVHLHYDFIIQIALYFYVILSWSTLLGMIWKMAHLGQYFFQVNMLSPN